MAKLTVIIPSRGRTNSLIGALTSLHKMESGKNEVTYGIACDSDDPATIGTCESLQTHMRLAFRVNKRGPSLGQMVNEVANDIPADVYLSLGDDSLCLTPGWDEMIAEAHRANPKGVWFWTPHTDEVPVLYAIVSHQWKEAAGQIFTDFFPYWYDDLWLLGLWIMATEGPMLTVPCVIMDCPRETHRMRDLRFWHRFYLAMMPLRVKQANEIARKLDFPQSRIIGADVGLPNLSITDALAVRLSATSPEFERDMDKIEATQGDKSPPTESYLKAKARAELLMKQIAFLKGAAPTLQRLCA